MTRLLPRLALCLPGLLLAVGLASAQEPTPAPAAAAPAPAMANRPIMTPGNAVWAANSAEARAIAKADKKLVYYEFVSPECGDCRRMTGLIYPAFDFEALLIGTVPVHVALSSAEGKELGERYSITEEPSVLIATPEGRVVFLMQGFKDAGDFYTHAHRDIDAYRKFAKVVDSQDVPTLSAAEAYSTGRALYARFDYEGAASRLARAAAAPDAKPDVRESALMGLAAADRQLGRYAAARKAADKVITTTKNADQKERAELFVAELALAQNKPGDALTAYRKFAKDHPKSPYLEKVRGFIAKLESEAPKS
jgi:tetratricopeptide (TPR) repeat protein